MNIFPLTDQTDFDAPEFSLNVFDETIGTGEISRYKLDSITDESDIISFELFISTDSFEHCTIIRVTRRHIQHFIFIMFQKMLLLKTLHSYLSQKIYYDNSSSDTSQIFEIIDIIDPEVVITYPTEDIIVPEYENFTIDWQQSDNIGIASHLFEYSANGVDYDTLLFNTDEYQQLSQSFSLNGVTATGRVKLTVNDLEGNSSTDYSAQIVVQDKYATRGCTKFIFQ